MLDSTNLNTSSRQNSFPSTRNMITLDHSSKTKPLKSNKSSLDPSNLESFFHTNPEKEPVTNLNSQPQMKLSSLKTCPISSRSIDPSSSLETISSMNPSYSSMDSTMSKNSNISTSENYWSPNEQLKLMNIFEKFSGKVDAMTVKLNETSEVLKQK